MLALLDHQMPVRLHHSRDMLYTACSSKQDIEIAKLTALWYMEIDEIFSYKFIFFTRNHLKNTINQLFNFKCSVYKHSNHWNKLSVLPVIRMLEFVLLYVAYNVLWNVSLSNIFNTIDYESSQSKIILQFKGAMIFECL